MRTPISRFRAALLAAALPAVLGAGCGGPPDEPQTCEELNQATVELYGDCGITLTPAPADPYWTPDQECLLQCNWPCNRDAPCGALDGSDQDAAASRLDCLLACNAYCL
jgi:hypothetical protein